MYGGRFIYPQKAKVQTRHTYEQEFGDIKGLPSQNKFPAIFLITDDPV